MNPTLDVLRPLIANTIDERLDHLARLCKHWPEFLPGAAPRLHEFGLANEPARLCRRRSPRRRSDGIMRAMMRTQVMWTLVIGATATSAPGRAAPATAAKPAADPPIVLFTEADDDLDADAAVQRIVAELELADQGKPRTLTIFAVTTDAWGCDCPTFVYSPFSSSAPLQGHGFLYPSVKAGPDPAHFAVAASAGRYELTGHFLKTKAKIPRAQVSSAGKPDNVFAVDRWCFRKAADVPEAYANVLAKMTKAGVKSCP